MPQPQMEKAARAISTSKGYEFLEFKGEGTFKETFHVRLNDGTSSALKVCRPGLASERTDREINAMVRCVHPNIARLLSVDHFSFEGDNYLILLEEYLSGGTLTERLSAQGSLNYQELVDLGRTLISALGTVAAEGLVHRDLKPDNVMFRQDRITPVVVDFGIVRDLGSSSLTGTWQMRGPGSPYYASPEQLNNEKQMIDWRTDQFALGVLLSICSYGMHPYSEDGDAHSQTVDRVANRTGPANQFSEKIVATNLSILGKMVAPWPVQRFRIVDDLVAAWPQ